MADTRKRIIDTTAALLEEQGYHGTGIRQIVERSHAPRGSLYYYFPDGKDEISEEAVRQTGRRVESNIRQLMAAATSAAAGIETLMHAIAERMEASGYRAGGPITTVALESAPDNSRINGACQDVYRTWHEALQQRMIADGVQEGHAARLATTTLAAIEGAMVLSRTYQSRQPLEDTATSLAQLIETAAP